MQPGLSKADKLREGVSTPSTEEKNTEEGGLKEVGRDSTLGKTREWLKEGNVRV